jgi:hypothetical protein
MTWWLAEHKSATTATRHNQQARSFSFRCQYPSCASRVDEVGTPATEQLWKKQETYGVLGQELHNSGHFRWHQLRVGLQSTSDLVPAFLAGLPLINCAAWWGRNLKRLPGAEKGHMTFTAHCNALLLLMKEECSSPDLSVSCTSEKFTLSCHLFPIVSSLLLLQLVCRM